MTARPADWGPLTAPSLDDIERIGIAVLAGLPREIRALTGVVQIRVAEFADEDVLGDLGIESEFDLLGLFQGVGLAQDGASPQTGQLPNMVWLYRRPLLDQWAAEEETLEALVGNVLIHELGHHFGFSDEDMDSIEAAERG